MIGTTVKLLRRDRLDGHTAADVLYIVFEKSQAGSTQLGIWSDKPLRDGNIGQDRYRDNRAKWRGHLLIQRSEELLECPLKRCDSPVFPEPSLGIRNAGSHGIKQWPTLGRSKFEEQLANVRIAETVSNEDQRKFMSFIFQMPKDTLTPLAVGNILIDAKNQRD